MDRAALNELTKGDLIELLLAQEVALMEWTPPDGI